MKINPNFSSGEIFLKDILKERSGDGAIDPKLDYGIKFPPFDISRRCVVGVGFSRDICVINVIIHIIPDAMRRKEFGPYNIVHLFKTELERYPSLDVVTMYF